MPSLLPTALRRRRLELGLSQRLAAARAGIPSRTVGRWERGQFLPGRPLLTRYVSVTLKENAEPWLVLRLHDWLELIRQGDIEVSDVRRQLLEALEGGPRTPRDLADAFGVELSTLRGTAKNARDAGLVRFRDGRVQLSCAGRWLAQALGPGPTPPVPPPDALGCHS